MTNIEALGRAWMEAVDAQRDWIWEHVAFAWEGEPLRAPKGIEQAALDECARLGKAADEAEAAYFAAVGLEGQTREGTTPAASSQRCPTPGAAPA